MQVQIAIIGGGPGGLSAATHAAELRLSHVLLEASPAHANTIQRYQKGKHVMDEPAVLPLRSPLSFQAGTREAVLAAWGDGLQSHDVDIRYGTEVTGIAGQRGSFEVTLKSGERVNAESVVMAIGVQGNPRRLGVPGEDAAPVQYTLDDPDEYRAETIVVVGAGDAAIENALGLAGHNTVILVNRRDEFARAKEGNLNLVMQAIEDGQIQCFYSSTVARLEPGDDKPATITLNTPGGEARVDCDRIIGRIGAIPPRRFVEGCGIHFPSADPTALPELSSRYESSVSGLYVIGALAGYPLIKQAMNQGYEVIEYILGNAVQPADHPILETKFADLPYGLDVDETLAFIQERIPVFTGVNPLVFRELMLASDILVLNPGEPIFAENDYTNSFLTILEGSVGIESSAGQSVRLPGGQFFGEMSLLSGRRRSATARAHERCVLVESPRRELVRLMNTYPDVRRVIDGQFVIRALQSSLVPEADVVELENAAAAAHLNHYAAGDSLFEEGDEADSLHLVRSGSVAVSRTIGEREIVTSYVAAGNYVGEMGLLGGTQRTATVRATVNTESISLDAATFSALLERNPGLRERVQKTMQARLSENIRMEAQPEAGDVISFLMEQGLGEATDVLLIDESLCIGCDNCEKACAETHGGTSRLDRAAGPTYARVHVPTSCRHCEDPHCMIDCPPDAIRRAPNGEVYIQDNCIGCGNCQSNCPYGVIQMAGPAERAPNLLGWLLFGVGPAPGQRQALQAPDTVKKAVKCDMCKDLAGGPACVRACPTGAAIRIAPAQFVDLARREVRDA